MARHNTVSRFLSIAGIVVVLAGVAPDLVVGAEKAATLSAGNIIALAERFTRFADELPATAQLGVETILAFEENERFVYVRGRGAGGDRRIVFCKPATFVLYDIPAGNTSWRLTSTKAPKVTERGFSVTEGEAVLTGRALLPGSTLRRIGANGDHAVEAVWKDRAAIQRYVNVLTVGGSMPKATLAEKDGTATVTLTSGPRTFAITLPADPEKSGTIGVMESGNDVLAVRQLPAGIMPHGPEGVRLLERWDSAYRRERAPGWDAGRPAPELKRAVESGAVRPGRALVLGCGAGPNAIYLAGKGFDVTGVDVAPSAFRLAKERARQAKVKVRWLVADVLAVPDLGAFDFIFDRGCYHHVRRYAAARFVATVTRLSHEKTQFLLLAGNANESRHYGPPRVKQTDIATDFAVKWDIVWLKEIRFDADDPNATSGAMAWSALLRRTARQK